MNSQPDQLDLITFVRRRAVCDEPPFELAHDRVVAAGRRHLRARRISLALRGTVAVGVLAVVAAVPAPADGHSPTTPTAVVAQ